MGSALAKAAARAALAEAGKRALAAKRRNGWMWRGKATRRPLGGVDGRAVGFSGAVWEFETAPENPLRLVTPDGVAFLPWWRRCPTDGGSVPGALARKWAAGFDLSRWWHACAYVLHDAAYSSGKVWLVDGGEARAVSLARRDADDLLCAGLCAEGEGGGGWVEAEAIAAGVRAFGGAAWKAWRERPGEWFSAEHWTPLFPGGIVNQI